MTYDRPEAHGLSSDAERRDRDRRRLRPDAILTRRQHRWLRIAGVVVIALTSVAIWALVAAEPGNTPEARPFGEVSVRGDALVLRWHGPACETVNTGRTQVAETTNEVTVTLYVDVPTAGCPRGADEETERTYRVDLRRPLGDRDLVDGACLLPGYFNAPACQEAPSIRQ